MLKLLVIEDHALVREGMIQTLRHLEPDRPAAEICILEAGNCDDGCAILIEQEDFDLVLLDLALPGMDGLTCLGLIRQRFPAVPVVIVSAYDDAPTVKRALKAGASGFIPKAYPGERMLAALRQVLAGQVYEPENLLPTSPISEPASTVVTETAADDFGLTERQAEVLGLMNSGKSNREIAALLGVSEGTVKIHVTAVLKALGVSSRTQAMVAVARHRIKL